MKTTRSKWFRAAGLALAMLTAASTVQPAPAAAASQVNLTGAGATFPYPIYSKWFDLYNKETGVQINYQSIGSGGGIQQVKAGTVDFGASDAPLNNQRLKEMPRPVVHFPTVAGAVVLAYNLPSVTTPLQLTPDVVAGIYLGKITKWNDKRIAASNPGVALPNSPIAAIHRSDGSGTTYIFTAYLSAVSAEWKELVGNNTSVSWPVGLGGKGNEGVSGLVRQAPGAIGYVELAYAKQNNFAVASVRNAAGKFIAPSIASTTAAANGAAAALAKDVRTPIVNSPAPDAYPIAGLTFLLVNKEQRDQAKGKAIADFIAWAMTEGQKSAEALDYAPLPESVVKVNQANLASLTFGGKPLVAKK
ncbi:MAG TPA: phosphate ABC transporter substrate-binding protein PstS [Candidatus Eisenbacteria bacterium]|nr:phosphate ABC transporter substrate-binding protein PstS [Candidatus Eisenbacteria bacterium]